ncbi:hypothetical protein FACS189426_23490 [Bacteroidia bacterium]|nr:hypothetical protein FACS189426_23490 [Bacteroidia bacterium]GHT85274.1 hypothetical protein FACS18947_3840 [Bacteroidia bacterium]
MTFKKEIEQYLEQIYILEETFRKVQNMDTLPLSFFSASIDVLNKLKQGVYELESAQLQHMMKHLKESEEQLGDVNESFKPAPMVETTGFLSDTIAKKIYADFSKSLTLNHRFMFQRDLFHGNTEEMNKTFTQLNSCHSLREALDYLNENYAIQWESDSGITLRDLLDKHFA